MASRPKGFGLTAEVKNKMNAKYDRQLAGEAMDWVAGVTEKGVSLRGLVEPKEIQAQLKDGVILCNLINALESGSVKKISDSQMAFKQMENIGNFLIGCEKYGCNKIDLFQTVDLYEGTNMAQVIGGIAALGRKVSQNGGKGFGPKESSVNKREFTEAQLSAGQNVIGLQMGSNKGASQAGQNFGKGRSIID